MIFLNYAWLLTSHWQLTIGNHMKWGWAMNDKCMNGATTRYDLTLWINQNTPSQIGSSSEKFTLLYPLVAIQLAQHNYSQFVSCCIPKQLIIHICSFTIARIDRQNEQDIKLCFFNASAWWNMWVLSPINFQTGRILQLTKAKSDLEFHEVHVVNIHHDLDCIA